MRPMQLCTAVLALAGVGGACAQTVPVALVPPANAALQQTLDAMTAAPAVSRAHWGISVVRLDGTVAAQVNAGQFFQPASNAKLLTTAASMALLPMDARLHTQIVAAGAVGADGVYRGDLALVGGGDANFSGRPVPYRATVPGVPEPPRDELRYVRELAAAVRAAGVTRVEGDVVGDDTLFPYDPYPQDWALDDLPWYYGAPVTPLMLADNALTLTVTPGAPATVSIEPAVPYYTVQATVQAQGTAGKETALQLDRTAGSRLVTVRGTMATGATPYVQDISIDHPAEYAAMALKQALEAEGVAVTGTATARETPLFEPDFDKAAGVPWSLEDAAATLPAGQKPCSLPATLSRFGVRCAIATHLGPPLYDDIVVTNKVSQNQHAEMFLRLLGLALAGTGTTAQGERVLRAFLTQRAGVDGGDFVMVDGSGLSGHDLVTPRALTTLLRYAVDQPWGARWKASLPVGGVDGSLRSRFAGPLKGRVFAKTGTLGEARALSGYLVANSGRTVVFSIMVTDHTPLDRTDEAAMDRMVAAIAAAE